MRRMVIIRNLATKFLALGVLFLAGIFSLRADDEPLGYFYHGHLQPLRLDASQIAVRIRSTSFSLDAGRRTLPSALRTRGFGTTDLIGEPIAGWTILDATKAKQQFTASGNIGGSSPASAQSESQTVHALIKSLIDSKDAAIEFVSPVFRDEQGGLILIDSRVLIGFARNCGAPERAALRSLVPEGAALERGAFAQRDAERWQINSRDGFVVLARANQLAQQSGITYAEPDMLVTGHTDLVPNDPSFSQSWGLANTGQDGGQVGFDMEATAAWDITMGSASVIVLIIDCGVQQNHPEINQIGGMDFTSDAPGNDGGPVTSLDNHGTWVAGCVSGRINNSLGSAGIAPAVQIASARSHRITFPGGGFAVNFSWVIDALNWGEAIGARVSNNSNTYNVKSSALESAYDNTRANGMVHFAATGNGGTSSIAYPASISSVNAVGALNRFGQRASFSQYGAGLKFMAPGDEIFSTDRTGSSGGNSGDYATVNGTSFATPYAAGVAALIISQWPNLTAAKVEARLQAACIDMGPAGYDTGYGYGLVDAFRAVSGINLPNLAPYQPSDWSDKLMVSNAVGSLADATSPVSSETLYLNFALINNGDSPAGAQFFVELFVDEQLLNVFSSTPPLAPNVDWEIQDYPLGTLTAGTHTMRIKIDSTDAVMERDENDNEYVKSVAITNPETPTPTPTPSATPTPRPISAANISTRGNAGTGDNVLIGGVIISGNQSKKVIVRGIGPSLTNYNVTGAMIDPTIELHDGTGALIAHNDNWGATEIDGMITQDQVAEIRATLPPGDNRESAIIATLAPGNYTAILRGKNGTSGIALAEVYELDLNGDARLAEISTRGNVQTGDNVMIGGIILSGNGTTDVLLRAIGPELSQYGVPDVLQDPELELHNGNGTTIAANDDWRSDQEQEIINTTLPPRDDRESAILTTLNAGNYTAVLLGKNGTTGIALVEAYILSGP